jgi:hypothetical protein
MLGVVGFEITIPRLMEVNGERFPEIIYGTEKFQ